MAITVIIQLALAGGLFLLGWWGRRRGAVLVAATLPEEVRIRRVTVLRRGALTCLLVAGLFVLITVLSLVLAGFR